MGKSHQINNQTSVSIITNSATSSTTANANPFPALSDSPFQEIKHIAASLAAGVVAIQRGVGLSTDSQSAQGIGSRIFYIFDLDFHILLITVAAK